MFSKLAAKLTAPQDGAALGAFRALFGALMLISTLRFVARGWVRELYLEPAFHFKYAGFGWVEVLPAPLMYGLFALMALSAVALALGYRTRIAALGFFVCFSYAELCDKATYLNHYYLVSLLAALLVLLPSAAVLSLDAQREGGRSVPAWCYWVLRAQVGVVYFYAGVAKLNADWLLAAQPLSSWLAAYEHVAFIGPLLARSETAYLFSWGGALFDLAIAPLLLHAKTRRAAYLAAVGFHLVVGLLFPIGMFPWIMLLAASVFFEPGWPRRLASRFGVIWERRASRVAALHFQRPLLALLSVHLLLQLVLPLRHVLAPGDVNWTEQGFRFAWRVMLVEKTGSVEYDVRLGDGVEARVYPRAELTPFQYRVFSTQPDMIWEYAQHVRQRYEAAGHSGVEVRARTRVSINGKPSAALLDPTFDLAQHPAPELGAGILALNAASR